MITRNLNAGLAMLALAGGCASTEAVRGLADKTAANIGTIGVHLRRLDANSRDIAERRANNISNLHSANAQLRARYEYDVALTRKTGGGPNLSLLDDIEQWQTQVDAIFESAQGAQAANKEAVLANQQKLDAKSGALTEVAQALAALAEEERKTDRLSFLIGYATSLKEELDTALEEDTKAATAAKQLLEEVKGTLDSGIGEMKSRGE